MKDRLLEFEGSRVNLKILNELNIHPGDRGIFKYRAQLPLVPNFGVSGNFRRLAASPSCCFTALPFHRFTESPTHRLPRRPV
jgi:hypothetical protein